MGLDRTVKSTSILQEETLKRLLEFQAKRREGQELSVRWKGWVSERRANGQLSKLRLKASEMLKDEEGAALSCAKGKLQHGWGLEKNPEEGK